MYLDKNLGINIKMEETKGIQIGKEEKLLLFVNDMLLYT